MYSLLFEASECIGEGNYPVFLFPGLSNQDLLVCPTGRPTRFGYAATILLARIPRILAKASLHKLVGLSLVHDGIIMPTCLVKYVTLSTPGTRMV